MEQVTNVNQQKQPRVLYLAFITSMFERFGYYIIGFLLTLYVKNVYNYSDTQAFTLFAIFTALGYLTPAIGGYLADNCIGIKRCLGLGLILEAMGYALLALPTPNTVIFYSALGFIIVGAGIFKTAPTNILGRAYEKGDQRIDSGFTLYYMGINVGSLASSIVAGSIQKAFGWHVPFAFAAAGLLLGFVWFLFFKHHAKDRESAAGKRPFSTGKWFITIAGSLAAVTLFVLLGGHPKLADLLFYVGSAAVIAYFIWQIIIRPRDEKIRIIVCLILIFMAVVFFLLYFQLYTSVALFIDRNVDRTFAGFEIPTVYFLGLNGFWIIVLSPFFAWMYRVLQKRGGDLSITTKFPLGILITGMCFFSMKFACAFFANSDAKI